jgi:hypothetical protein
MLAVGGASGARTETVKLIMSAQGPGSLSAPGFDCVARPKHRCPLKHLEVGQRVTFLAKAHSGYVFLGWEIQFAGRDGDCPAKAETGQRPKHPASPLKASCEFAIKAPKTQVTAIFGPPGEHWGTGMTWNP